MYAVPNSAEMANIDLESQERFGISGLLLMENAARSLYEGLVQFVEEVGYSPKAVRILFVAGPGNNGGDALALARMWLCLAGGTPQVLITSEPKNGTASSVHLNILERLGVAVLRDRAQDGADAQDGDAVTAELQSAEVVVDGLFGTGLRGVLRPEAVSLLERINRTPAKRVAIDIPSGVSDDFQGDRVAVKAHVTLAVELPKLCYYTEAARPLCGSIRVVPLGFPPVLIQPDLSLRVAPTAHAETTGRRAVLLDRGDLPGLIPDFNPYAHKYQRGALVVFAGSTSYPGAAVMACNAAVHSRAGYVHLYTDAAALQRMAALDPAVVASASSVDTGPPEAAAFHKFSAAIVGPGWGRDHGRVEQLKQLLKVVPPGVLDADGLYALEAVLNEEGADIGSLAAGWTLTPHHGEFERLGFGPVPKDADSRRAVLAECAAALCAVVVLKGPVTWIMAPDGRCAVYDGADPLLAAAGSGDVLCGCIASFRAAGAEAFEAACAGVLSLGAAAQAARRRHGVFSPGDLPHELGRVVAGAKALRPVSEVDPEVDGRNEEPYEPA